MEEISIGYLSWKRHNIFEQTLNSHKNNGLFDLIKLENRCIFFQEISDIDINLAKKYNCNFIGCEKNIGILNAFIKLVENCKTEYFIFCENDWFLIENKDVVEKILSDCIHLIKSNNIDIIKLRHRKFPGNPLHCKNIWNYDDCEDFPYKLESLHWLENPNNIYNNKLDEYTYNYKWYVTDLNNQKWSNNVFIAKTSYLKKIILPLIKNDNAEKNPYLSLESTIINHKDENFLKYTKIAGGYGLFTHKDYI